MGSRGNGARPKRRLTRSDVSRSGSSTDGFRGGSRSRGTIRCCYRHPSVTLWRAFERHSFLRWYLDSIAVWPHIELLLSNDEFQTLSDAKSDVAFFINVSLVSLLSAALLAFDMVVYRSAPSGFYLLSIELAGRAGVM